MNPTSFEAAALDWVVRYEIEEKERELAATLIQLVWRHQRRKQQMLAAPGRAERRLYKKQKQQFGTAFMKQVALIRHHRRKKFQVLRSGGTMLRGEAAAPSAPPAAVQLLQKELLDARQRESERVDELRLFIRREIRHGLAELRAHLLRDLSIESKVDGGGLDQSSGGSISFAREATPDFLD
eukprot:TRINITY_DN23712_c0_g1_i1.p1 TRINITY_DN23712_c0_g1~~TRINITY_DN23712_c0_g1_i1.p1  ORF type:complete len:182 (+),score=64.82 TRINITY_DN23712_c0_g1_i1:72-617(+)